MKTLEHYMDDPSVSHMQMPLREVKAIRLMIHDETKDLTGEELAEYYKQSVFRVKEEFPNIKFAAEAGGNEHQKPPPPAA